MTELTRTIARLILLPTLLVAAALVVRGYQGGGDGFSAGVLAGLGIAVQYLIFGPETGRSLLPPWLALGFVSAGLLLILGLAFLPVTWGHRPLTHFPQPGAEVIKFGTLELHTAMLLDLGIFLLVLGFLVVLTSVIVSTEKERPE